MEKMFTANNNVPIVDLMNTDETSLVAEIAKACSTAGFF
jgi:hypothetical protein